MEIKNWFSEDTEYLPPEMKRTSSRSMPGNRKGRNVNHDSDEDDDDHMDMDGSDGLEDDDSKSNGVEPAEDDRRILGNPAIKYPIKYKPHTNHVRKTYKCWYCPHVQYSLPEHETHEQGHLQEFPLKCRDCNYSCELPKTLSSHSHCHTPAYFVRKETKHRRSSKKSETLPIQPKAAAKFSKGKGNTPSPSLNIVKTLGKYKCADLKCPCSYENRMDLVSHMERHDTKSEFSCDLCTYSVRTKGHLMMHRLRHKAPISQNKSVKEKQVRISDRSHTRGAGYPCTSSNCPAAFHGSRELLSHLKRHTKSGGPNKCKLCTFSTFTKPLLEKHIALHKTKTNSKAKNSLLRPIKNDLELLNKTGTSIQNPSTSKTKSANICCTATACPQKFYNFKDFNNHMIRHTTRSEFVCKKCSFSCKTLKRLSQHTRHHPDLGPSKKKSSPKKVAAQNGSQIPSHPGTLLMKRRPLTSKLNGVAAYRRNGFIAKPNNSGLFKRLRRNLVKDGVISQEQFNLIKEGNPNFTYQPTVTSSGGRVQSAPYRCLHCPKSFATFTSYSSHQGGHKSSEVLVKAQDTDDTIYKCKHCVYECDKEDVFVQHCKEHVLGSASCSVVLNKLSVRKLSGELSTTLPGSLENFIESENLDGISDTNEDSPMEVAPNEESLVPPFFQDILEEDPTKPVYVLAKTEVSNFMGLEEEAIECCNNLSFLHSFGKTSAIVACLIGLGYDILLDLEDNHTLCGVHLNNVLRYGETYGLIEVTLQIKSSKILLEKYGERLQLKRHIFEGLPLAESEFEISYENIDAERITSEDVRFIMNNLIPTYALRLMVLNSENVEHFVENFHAFDEIFSTLAEKQRDTLLCKEQDTNSQLEHFKLDLESRNLRISYLRANVHTDDQDLPALKFLQKMQQAELKLAIEEYTTVENLYTALLIEEPAINAQPVDPLVKLLNKMRRPFQDFIHAQNYIGDIVLGDSGKELAVWIKDASTSQFETLNLNIDEARQIWKTLTTRRKQLAVTGVFLAFWQIMDCCPIMVADIYSSSDFEFSLPESALTVLVNIVRQNFKRQFLLSGKSAKEFVKKYT